MARSSSPLFVLSLVLSLVLVACGSNADTEPGGEPQSTDQAPLEQDREREWRGPVGVTVDLALSQVAMSDAQAEALRVIAESARMNPAQREELRAELKAAALDVVRLGSVDREQIDAVAERAVAALARHIDATASALEEVQETLDPRQRSELAAAFRDRINERFDRWARDDGEHHHRDAFHRFARHLALSAAQIAQLETLRDVLLDEKLRERIHPTREEMLALASAFEAGELRGAIDGLRTEKLERLRERFSRLGGYGRRALSIFSDGQRMLLADLIERGPREVLFGDD